MTMMLVLYMKGNEVAERWSNFDWYKVHAKVHESASADSKITRIDSKLMDMIPQYEQTFF
jgi:hypothetical protein